MSDLFHVGDVIKSLYRVVEVKRGGMGVVYICQRLPDDEVQADLKELSSSDKNSPQKLKEIMAKNEWAVFKSIETEEHWHESVRDRFQREALIWTTILPHPNIVRAKSVDTIGRLLYLWLEYIDGGSLRDRLAKGPIRLQDILSYSTQFCHGMEFLHRHYSIVHRDIKPENILITKEGMLKITDFGLSKTLDRKEFERDNSQMGNEDNALTKHGVIFGTVPYMSPEQFLDPLSVGKASDIYSFGVVMYEMLTGRLPFLGPSVNAFKTQHLNSDPASPGDIVQIPLGLDTIVLKCLQKKPENRFANFTELLSKLEECCQSLKLENIIKPRLTLAQLESRMTAQDWQGRGYAYGQLGQRGEPGTLEKSLECYKKSLDLDPLLGGSHLNFGQALNRLGRTKEALFYFEKEVEINPSAMHYEGLGVFYWKIARREDAITAIEKCLELAPNRIGSWGQLALMCGQMKLEEKYSNAIVTIEKLLTSQFDDPLSACAEAVFFGESGDFNAALYFHAKSVERFPNDYRSWYNAGVTFHKLERYQEAKYCYDNSLGIKPDFALTLVNRGLLSANARNINGAIRDWERAIQIDPNHPACGFVSTMLPMAKMFPAMVANMAKLGATLVYSY
jgi:serine/threonine protein kinase